MGDNLELQRCVEVLAAVRLFAGLNTAQLSAIARLCTPVILADGEYLLQEGAEAEDFFILLAGEVSVFKQLKLPQLKLQEGVDRVLRRLTAEQRPVLGETALIGELVRKSSVRCQGSCEFYRVSAARLAQLVQQEPLYGSAIYRNLSALLYDRVETANTDVVKLSAALVFALEE